MHAWLRSFCGIAFSLFLKIWRKFISQVRSLAFHRNSDLLISIAFFSPTDENDDAHQFLKQSLRMDLENLLHIYAQHLLSNRRGDIMEFFESAWQLRCSTISHDSNCVSELDYSKETAIYLSIEIQIHNRLPWNQQTQIGFFIEIVFTTCVGEIYLIVNGSFLLLFISICLHHQAFSKMFQYFVQKFTKDDEYQNHKDFLCHLFRFHVSVKE